MLDCHCRARVHETEATSGMHAGRGIFPTSFLGNAGQLDLLRAGGATRSVVPSSVLDEVTQHADQAALSIAGTEWIERAPAISIPDV
jgi:hypothetical protein